MLCPCLRRMRVEVGREAAAEEAEEANDDDKVFPGERARLKGLMTIIIPLYRELQSSDSWREREMEGRKVLLYYR